jgi:formate transporter
MKNIFKIKKINKKYFDFLIKGVYAGIMIGIGGTIFLSCSNRIVGSFLFAIGLLMICMYGMNLFTGKVGYALVNKINYLWELLISLLGNFIGTYIVGFLIRQTRFSDLSQTALNISNLKLNDNLLSIFILSLFCGILMYIAVNNYKKVPGEVGKYIGIFLCVMVFILCGFEHCVANMYYFTVANVWNAKAFLYLLVMILGNSAGSLLIALFYNRFYKN